MKYIDGSTLAQLFTYGAANLGEHAKFVDALNVFPVPDGDTGTNMNLTITAGAKEVNKAEADHAGTVADAFAKGLLMGARGNSGVILSQLFRGFSKEVSGKKELTTTDFAKGLVVGSEAAYKAVMKPVEGTILTVAKDAAKYARKAAKKHDDFVEFIEAVVVEARASLRRTPDLLPVLKEVGIVDSGGQGLVFIYEGFYAALKGEQLPSEDEGMTIFKPVEEYNTALPEHVHQFMSSEEIEYGFCTEVMVRRNETASFDEDAFKQQLNEYGDSLLVISDEELIKVHIHAEQPGEVLTLSQSYGELIKIKIENMREQHAELVRESEAEKEPLHELAVVTVSMGEGIADLFTDLGVKQVIVGGQTMNPSTEDVVKAIKEVRAKNVIILPNNSNVIMTAEQAAAVVGEHVAVVPTKTIPQGLAAMITYNEAQSIEENVAMMTDAIKTVKSGQVTFAVRSTTFGEIQIKEGDFIGIAEKEIVSTGMDRTQVAKQLCEQLIDEESEIVTIIQGEDCTEDETKALVAQLELSYEDIEFEVHIGKQPIYSYIISVE